MARKTLRLPPANFTLPVSATFAASPFLAPARREQKCILSKVDPARSRKEFWNWTVFFVTRDDSLNKAHIGYLETQLIQLAKEAKRAKLDNQNLPQPSPVTEADAADMDSFLADILSILPLVGLSAFEKPTPATPDNTMLYVKDKGIEAEGCESAQGFVVRAGATAVVDEPPSLRRHLRTLRKNLVDQGVLVREGDVYRFAQDYEFASSTKAVSAVMANHIRGLKNWKDRNGRMLRELKKVEAESEE